VNNKIILILIGIIGLNILLWPKKQEKEYVDRKLGEIKEINIRLEGEVVYPGTYIFHDAISYGDLFSFAGGLNSDADTSNINLSDKITKSRNVIISKTKKNVESKNYFKVNINTATYNDLIKLNLSEKKALSILLYREQNGLFNEISDLLKVKYIGKETLEKISKNITTK